MADQFSPCLITAMNHLWFHHAILFPEPSPYLSKTLNPSSSSLSLSSPLDDVDELPLSLEESEEESSDSSTINYPQEDDTYGDDEQEEENKESNLKERPTRLILNRGRSNSSQSSSPPAQKCPIETTNSSSSKLQKSMSCRSLMELELEEVKGFMDLGFRFNKEHLSPRMMIVLPGLQRAKLHQVTEGYETEEDRDEEEGRIIRPYLSEAWLIKRPDSPLLNLKMPRFTAAADMKKHLQFWAKTVASTVQQKC